MLSGRRGSVLKEQDEAGPSRADTANWKSQAEERNTSRQVSVNGKYPPCRSAVCLSVSTANKTGRSQVI